MNNKIEGFVRCDPKFAGKVIGESGYNIRSICKLVGDKCFILYEDWRLPLEKQIGHFYIHANSHDSVKNAIQLLKIAETAVKERAKVEDRLKTWEIEKNKNTNSEIKTKVVKIVND